MQKLCRVLYILAVISCVAIRIYVKMQNTGDGDDTPGLGVLLIYIILPFNLCALPIGFFLWKKSFDKTRLRLLFLLLGAMAIDWRLLFWGCWGLKNYL